MRIALHPMSMVQVLYSWVQPEPMWHLTQLVQLLQLMHAGGEHGPPPLLLDADELDEALLLADDDDAPVDEDDAAEDDEPACAMLPDPLACRDEDACALEPLPPAPLLS